MHENSDLQIGQSSQRRITSISYIHVFVCAPHVSLLEHICMENQGLHDTCDAVSESEVWGGLVLIYNWPEYLRVTRVLRPRILQCLWVMTTIVLCCWLHWPNREGMTAPPVGATRTPTFGEVRPPIGDRVFPKRDFLSSEFFGKYELFVESSFWNFASANRDL